MMNLDLVFSFWLADFKFLEAGFTFISGRLFSFSLFAIFSVFMILNKRYRDLLFVFIALIIGDFIGAQLKDLIQEARPCFNYFGLFSQANILEEPCGSRLTRMPSNHALSKESSGIMLRCLMHEKQVVFRFVSWKEIFFSNL